jgi:hypothetical protein
MPVVVRRGRQALGFLLFVFVYCITIVLCYFKPLDVNPNCRFVYEAPMPVGRLVRQVPADRSRLAPPSLRASHQHTALYTCFDLIV